MDEKTLTALKGSIAKWQGIVNGTEIDHGTENCPLCKMFYDTYDPDFNEDDSRYMRENCFECPVRQKTGQSGCNGTPYEKWQGFQVTHITPELKAQAQEELKFLESLLLKTKDQE